MTRRAIVLSGCPGDTRRYRATHAAEALTLAGWEARVRATDEAAAWPTPAELAAADALILHRVAWDEAVAAAVDAARAGGARVLFDTDDLVFDEAFEARRAALRAAYGGAARAGLVEPPAAFRATLAACDAALVTTGALAAELNALGHRAHVLRNALDLTLLRLSTRALAARGRGPVGRGPERVVVGYASGTPTHDRDFQVVAPVLRAAMADDPRIVLRVIGPLDLSDAAWAPLAERVERVPFMRWPLLPAALAALDLNLAPLEVGDPFCEAKSELKWLEAGAVGVPTIASPTDAYRHAVRDGEDGLLAATPEAWRAALERLVGDAAARAEMGAAARRAVLEGYVTDLRAGPLSAAASGAGAVAAPPASGPSATAAVLEDVPGLDRHAMGDRYVAAERAARAARPPRARGPWLAAWLRSPLGAPDARAVPYALDVARWRPGPPAAERPPRVLLDVAPEPPVDGSTTALGLEALVVAAARAPELEVALFGTAPGARRPDDPRMADWAWLGALDDEARAEALRAAAAVVAPGCANLRPAVLEAMAAGCAVVGCDVPPARWLLVEGRTAALAPPQADALGAAIARTVQDGARRARIVRGGQAAAERHTAGRAAAAAAEGGEEGAAGALWLDRLQPLWDGEGLALAPDAGGAVGWSFVARADGLCRVDVLLSGPLPPGASLRLELLAAPGAPAPLAVAEAAHGPHVAGEWTALTFPPLAPCAGRRLFCALWARGGAPGASYPALLAADAAVFAAGRTYVDGAASDHRALAVRTFHRPPAPPARVAEDDPRQPWLDALRDLAHASAELGTAHAGLAESAPFRLAEWLARWWAPLPPLDQRPWPPDAPLGRKLAATLRHYGPVAVAREAIGALRWRRMSAAERAEVLRRDG